MPRRYLIGRLFGTDIFVTADFFLLLAFYFLVGRADAGRMALFCLALIVSLLVHEFGHVLAVRRLLKAPSAIILWGLGGLCVYPAIPTTPGRKIGISLMGPLLEAVLGALCLALLKGLDPEPGALREFLVIMVWVNLFWVAANLLPILPLDGGQALRAGLEYRMAPERAALAARRVSVVTAILAGGAAASLGLPFAAILCAFLMLQNLRPAA